MSNDQKKVVAGAIAAVVFSVTFFEVVLNLTNVGSTPLAGVDVSTRLEYALRCEVFAALCLLAGVGKVGNRRFFTPEAITGDPAASIEIDRRYVQNSTEQLLLAMIAHLTLVLIVPDGSTRVVAILVMLFVIGRVTFWIGYHISGPA